MRRVRAEARGPRPRVRDGGAGTREGESGGSRLLVLRLLRVGTSVFAWVLGSSLHFAATFPFGFAHEAGTGIGGKPRRKSWLAAGACWGSGCRALPLPAGRLAHVRALSALAERGGDGNRTTFDIEIDIADIRHSSHVRFPLSPLFSRAASGLRARVLRSASLSQDKTDNR